MLHTIKVFSGGAGGGKSLRQKRKRERVEQIDDQVAQLQRELRDTQLQAESNDLDDEELQHFKTEIQNLELEILVLQQERDEITGD